MTKKKVVIIILSPIIVLILLLFVVTELYLARGSSVKLLGSAVNNVYISLYYKSTMSKIPEQKPGEELVFSGHRFRFVKSNNTCDRSLSPMVFGTNGCYDNPIEIFENNEWKTINFYAIINGYKPKSTAEVLQKMVVMNENVEIIGYRVRKNGEVYFYEKHTNQCPAETYFVVKKFDKNFDIQVISSRLVSLPGYVCI